MQAVSWIGRTRRNGSAASEWCPTQPSVHGQGAVAAWGQYVDRDGAPESEAFALVNRDHRSENRVTFVRHGIPRWTAKSVQMWSVVVFAAKKHSGAFLRDDDRQGQPHARTLAWRASLRR